MHTSKEFFSQVAAHNGTKITEMFSNLRLNVSSMYLRPTKIIDYRAGTFPAHLDKIRA